jgi:hypothetical protein
VDSAQDHAGLVRRFALTILFLAATSLLSFLPSVESFPKPSFATIKRASQAEPFLRNQSGA